MGAQNSNRRSLSYTTTSVSMKSDKSMGRSIAFRGGDSSTEQMGGASSNRRPPSPTPTSVSMKSDDSMGRPITFTGGDSSTEQTRGTSSNSRSPSPTITCVPKKIDWSMARTMTFKSGDSSTGNRYQQIHKSHLQKKFPFEGTINQGHPTSLRLTYTEPRITEGGGEVNDEHEVRQLERASWRESAQGSPIKCSVIFKPLSGQDKPIRTVLTKGLAGIGKTVSVQKFILDWVEGTANQDVHFIFPLPFRELNLMTEKKFSLVGLIQHFFPEIKDHRVFTCSKNRSMFIFDGLDECRLPLDFNSHPECCDVTKPASVDVLLTNLIRGNLLPSALLWITTRPAAANRIPRKCVDQVTEIKGFNDPQKEEYFRKRISDENLASKTITHLKSSRSLYIMCHIPVFCWISATVVVRTSEESESLEMPRTLTQWYTHFLIIQTNMKRDKFTDRKERDEDVIFNLGKLAFQQLEKGNLIFYEDDLKECVIDVTEASVYSGVCTQVFREESEHPGVSCSFICVSQLKQQTDKYA
ncbi:NLR family CARD domain-containing protein 3-like [Alosa pseudoharengus]|uniref:NLR family CARD domain-containing protein 3-like n=1 Tax=Alosa pseudoharengus TaxID=34774 RepID=UPI003F89153E